MKDAKALLGDAIAALGRRFLLRTQSDIAELQALLATLSAGGSTALESLRELAHRIRGGGATFGFPAIGECAAELEQRCDELEHRGTLFGSNHSVAVHELEERIQRLVRALEDTYRRHFPG